jgi:hypothetical protein
MLERCVIGILFELNFFLVIEEFTLEGVDGVSTDMIGQIRDFL